MHRVFLVATVLLFATLAIAAQYANKTEEEFVKAGDQCFKEHKLPQSYEALFESFSYPDEPLVHEYLRCIWMKLELWDDKAGFNVEHIADLYKDKAKPEELTPILNDCNRNTDQDPMLKWLYRGFMCILNGRIGDWFKEDVKNYISQQ